MRTDLSHLLLVIRQEDLDGVKRLCSNDPEVVERQDEKGTTALQCASAVGSVPILRCLLNTGNGGDLVDRGSKTSGMTPLMLAAAGGHGKAVLTLLAANASAACLDKRDWTALHHAAAQGHDDVCEKLLEERKSELQEYVQSAFALAASRRHLEACQALQAHGASPAQLESQEDKSWFQDALSQQAKLEFVSKASERALSRAASQAAYSDDEDEEIMEDEGESGGEEEQQEPRPRSPMGTPPPLPPQHIPSPPISPSGPREHFTTNGPTRPFGVPSLSLPGQGVVLLPSGSRRAHPMYVRHQAAREPYIPTMAATAPLARGGRSVFTGAGSVRGSLPNLGYRTAPMSASPRSPSRSSLSGAASPVGAGALGRSSLNMQRAPRGGAMRPVMSAQPRSGPAGTAAHGPRPYSTNTFRAPAHANGSSLDYSQGLGTANGGASSSGWTLHAFSYRGVQEGLLLDRDTCLIYWMDPLAQLQRRAQQEAEDAGVASPQNGAAAAPQTHLVGKLLPGVGGLDAPQYGRIAPLTNDDVGTLELSKPALRCLRQTMPAAALLHSCARPSAPNAKLLADLVPGLGTNQALASAVSLVVPLCGVLGIQKISELANLTEKDLIQADVDTCFLPALHELAAGSRSHDSPHGTRPFSSQSRVAESKDLGRSGARSTKTGGGGGAKGDGEPMVEALPSLSQLLAQHGLLKLLPQAAEKKLLSSLDVHRWHELASASSAVPLSRPELARFRALLSAIRVVQDTALEVQSRRLELLLRLTVGSLVLYEADPIRAAQREERLLGVILEDLGPGVGASGKQYKVRDLLDDSISWMTLGQVRRVAPGEALGHLRADLLPPPTLGCPVTPLSAFPGQPVQVAMWSWTPPPEPATQDILSGIGPEPEEDARSRAVQQQVIGRLVQPVPGTDGLKWLVSWPDGSHRTHCTGARGAFELVHLQLHKLACAPLAHKHYDLLLCGQDMLCVPVVRSPLWARPSTDDTVPGSLGVGCLDASQTALTVMWSRSRASPPSLYSPDAQGQYPLCHGLLGGWPLTALCAKAGVVVEPGPGGMLSLQGVASAGPGTLVAPVRMAQNGCGVVWRVKWAGGAFTEHELGVELQEPELLVHESNMAHSSDNRVALLNEVTKRNAPTKSGAASMAANLGAANAVASLNKAPETAAAAAAAAAGRLGRPLFCRNAAQAARAGMLGALVKLNLGALALQPGCDQGPMQAFERTSLSAMLEARKAQTPLGPLPRDDVGIVVRDAGPGTWRGLMVRKLGSTEGFWYDETVLLPATNSDIHKQILRRGPKGAFYMMPRHEQGVPVTDANAAPGMLVQRAYTSGAVLDGSEKATMLGELLRPAGPHQWEVQWRDGTLGVYKTGANNRFQLCFLNLHAATGAPLLYSTVVSQAAMGATRMPVTDGPHCCAGGAEPGEVRYVLDPDTMQGLMQQEMSMLSAAGMVVTSTGERRSCGSMLRLYELSHAIVPGDALTIYTAKRGLHVALIEYNTEQREAEAEGSSIPNKGPVRLGVLQAPTRLAVQAVLDAGSGGGSGSKNGPTASRPSVLLMDPSRCYWEVLWEGGRTEELAVGTQPSHTCLRVAPQRKDSNAGEEEQEEGQEEEEEEAPKKVEQIEHYVRMVEPVMLLPTRDEAHDKKLVSLAKPLQRAIGWNNQLMREMCRVWWWSSRLAAEDREEQQRQAEESERECTQLWRPELKLTSCQPDQLSMAVCSREPEMLRWTVMTEDRENVVCNLVGMELDRELADAVSQLTFAMAEIPALLTPLTRSKRDTDADADGDLMSRASRRSEFSSEVEAATENGESSPEAMQPPGQLHLVLQGQPGSTALHLAPATLVDSAGCTWSAPPRVTEAIRKVNEKLRAYRAHLAVAGKEEDEEGGAREVGTQFELQVSVEPSLESGKPGASQGKSAVLSIVRETPPPLQAHDASTLNKTSSSIGRSASRSNHRCSDGGDVTWVEGGGSESGEPQPRPMMGHGPGKARYVGPAEMLTTGEAPALQALMLSGHRALGALHGAATSATANTSPSASLSASGGNGALGAANESPILQLMGDAPWCEWVDVPEHPMPRHLGPVRCMAAVNVQLFTLRRMCTRLNGAAGLGSANMKEPLLAVLKLVHAKARASLAGDAAQRRMQLAARKYEEGREDAFSCKDGQDVQPFDWKDAEGILERVRAALANLAAAELAAEQATVFAEEAVVPTLFEGRRGAQGSRDAPRQESAQVLAKAKEATNRAYPDAADAVQLAAQSVSHMMCYKLVQAEQKFMESSFAEERAKEAQKAARQAEQLLNDALESIQNARDTVSSKERDLQNAINAQNMQRRAEDEARSALAEAQAEAEEASGADEQTKKAKDNNANSARTEVTEREEAVTKAGQYVEKVKGDLQKARDDEMQAHRDAKRCEDERDAKQHEMASALAEAKRAKQAARKMSPGSALEESGAAEGGASDDKRSEIMAKQLTCAQSTTACVEAALTMLRELESHMPPSVRVPEAMARKLKTDINRITLVCASTAAEWVRTACLPLDSLVLDMEEKEANFRAAEKGRAQTHAQDKAGERESGDGRGMTRSPSGKAPAPAPPAKYVATLPPVPEVAALMSRVHNDLLAAYRSCHTLTPHIQPEAEQEITDPHDPSAPSYKVSRPVIYNSMGRSIQLAASALEKLASAANDNAKKAFDVSKAALEEAAKPGQSTQPPPGSAPSTYVPEVVRRELPSALKALRITELALRAAKSLPTAAEIPLPDPGAASKLANTVKAVESAQKAAQRSVNELVKFAVQALVKSALGGGAWTSSVLCVAYADLALKSEAIDETALWVREAFKCWPSAKEGADAAIKALVPPPPKEKKDTEGGEGDAKEEESSAAAEKAKADKEAAAAEKAQQLAETERTITSYITGISLKLALAGSEWSFKTLEYFTPNSIDEIPPDRAVAALQRRRQQQAGKQVGPHPSTVVEHLHELAEPLQLVDQAARAAGNQLGLSKVDEAICDVMKSVAGGVKQHSIICAEGWSNSKGGLQREADEDKDSITKFAAARAKMADVAAGYVACAKDGLAAVEALQPWVSLMLLPEEVDREIEEAKEVMAELEKEVEGLGFANGGARATANSKSSGTQGSLKLRLKIDLKELEPTEAFSKGRRPSPNESSPRKLGTPAVAVQAVPAKPPPVVPAYELGFCFEHDPDSVDMEVLQGQEEVIVKLMQPARQVLDHGEVDTFLTPYRTLMAAANEAAAAAAAAEACTPSEDLMVTVASAAPVSSKSGPGGGSTDPVQRYAATTNLSQLRRWAASVANMRAAAALVTQGFHEAAAAAEEELDPLSAPLDL